MFGPVGAGKTVSCIPMELLFRMCQQAPGPDGVRLSRWGVVRRSFPQLKTSTIKTFEEWIGHLGKLTYGSPIEWKAKFPLPDGTYVQTEVWFMALENEKDIDKLKSVEFTGIAFSECAEIPKQIVDVARGRLDRYPTYGPTWCGIWGESNPPSMASWWYKTLEDEKPKGFEVYRQPPPLIYAPGWNALDPEDHWMPNPDAENIRAEMGGYEYYKRQIPGADWDYINVFILGNYGTVKSGKPVYPEFSTQHHKALDPIKPIPHQQVVIGMDFGLDASAVPTQLGPSGELLVFPEINAENMALEPFIRTRLKPVVQTYFRGCPVLIVGDPSSDRRETVSTANAYQQLQSAGLKAVPAISNDPRLRQEAVKHFLLRRDGFYIDPNASMLIEGFTGGYQFDTKLQGSERLTVYRAKKNQFSHPHDALQYAALHHYRGSVMDKPKRPMVQGSVKKYLMA